MAPNIINQEHDLFITSEPLGYENTYLGDLRVLYVEDEEEIRTQLGQFLSRRVGQLLIAENGREGLAMFQDHRPDIVISDILMPEMNGLDMTEAIRHIDQHVPIIITTAFNETSHLMRAIELGIDAFVIKPIKINQLLTQLLKCAKIRSFKIALQESNTVLRKILACLNEAVFIEDFFFKRIIDCNISAETLFGLSRLEIINTSPAVLFAADEELTGQIQKRPPNQLRMQNKDGKSFPCEYLTSPIQDSKGQTTFIVHVVRDITLQKQAEAVLLDNQHKLEFMAHHDPLTGLTNRLLLEERLSHCLLRAKRQEISLALLFMDLDEFKAVNDRWGHETGDELLKAVATRLLQTVREQDTLARFGGDEFVLLLEDMPETTGVSEVAQKIILALSEPFQLKEQCVNIGVTIGISFFSTDGDNTETIIQQADQAMYHAKKLGGRRYSWYSPEI
jgi:diguanylate cyclase (GGDEF)-like protein/PAS domain S-box-containing protein